MYGLPEDLDRSAFVGKRLDSVVFHEFMVSLSFEGYVGVSVSSNYSYSIGDGGTEETEDAESVTASSLMRVVARTVVSTEATRDGTLTLRFVEGGVFRCYDDRSNYECYTITMGGKEIDV